MLEEMDPCSGRWIRARGGASVLVEMDRLNNLRECVVQLPTYFAYTLRATLASRVPLTIARPSVKRVSS